MFLLLFFFFYKILGSEVCMLCLLLLSSEIWLLGHWFFLTVIIITTINTCCCCCCNTGQHDHFTLVAGCEYFSTFKGWFQRFVNICVPRKKQNNTKQNNLFKIVKGETTTTQKSKSNLKFTYACAVVVLCFNTLHYIRWFSLDNVCNNICC